MAKEFDVGDKVRVSAEFRDFDNALTDPDAVLCRSRTPSGIEAAQVVTQDGEGLYHAEVMLTEAGRWHFRFTGTGETAAAVEKEIVVRRSAFDAP